MEMVQAVKKLNSKPRERLNFTQRRPIWGQLCEKTLNKQATSEAQMINFSFEFFMQFSHQTPFHFLITMVQKSEKMTKNSNQRVLP